MRNPFYTLILISFLIPSTVNLFQTFSEHENLSETASMAIYDVSLTKNSISGGPIKYGVSVPFTIVVRNDGDMPITNVDVIDYLPPGLAFEVGNNPNWSPEGVIPNAYVRRITSTINPGQTVTITINLVPQPSKSADDWTNQAEVYAFQDDMGNQVEDQDPDSTADKIPGDPDAEDDHDYQTIRIFDLALKKELITPQPYYYNDVLTFRNTVYNQGNETTGECLVTDYITEGYEYDPGLNFPLGWVGAAPTPFYTFDGLAPGDSVVFDIQLRLLPDMFDAGAWDNYAEIFVIRDASGVVVNANEADSTPNSNSPAENNVKPGDPDDNNILGNGPAFGEDEDDHDPAAPRILDVALKKERATAVPSYSYTQNVEFVIEIHNQGNVALDQIVIVDTIVCGLEWIPGPNPGWVYDASINAARYIDNSPPAPATSKTISLFLGVNPCYNVNPQIGWDNYTEIESVTASDGGSNEDIDANNDHFFLNDSGGKVNTPDDNELEGLGPREGEDEDDHDVERVDVFDLAIINEIITPVPYAYGQTLDFRVRMINQGNIIADSTEVRSHIPPGLTYSQALNGPLGWSTVNGNTVSFLHNKHLMPKDTAEFILKLTVAQSSGKLDWVNRTYVYIPRDTMGLNRGDDADSYPFGENNGERAVLPGSPGDNNIFVLGPPGTNMDEDDHDPAGFMVADLALTKTIAVSNPPYAFGEAITFNINVTNEGGSIVNSFTIVDYLRCGYNFSPVGNGGWVVNGITGNPEYTHNSAINPGQTVTIPITLTFANCANPTADSWVNAAEIKALTDEDGGNGDFDSTPDDTDGNDAPGEDDYDEVGIIIYDLSLEKDITSNISDLSYGDPIDFDITINNEGNIGARNTEITEYLRCGYSFNPGINPGWSQDGITGYLKYTHAPLIPPGQSAVIPLTLNLQACTSGPGDPWYNLAEISDGDDENNNPGDDNDSTPDENPDNDLPGEDDNDDTILPIFDLTLNKDLVENRTYQLNEVVGFEITVRNEGNVTSNSFVVVDYIPCGFAFVQANNPGWVLGIDGYARYNVNTPLNPLQSTTLTLNLTTQSCGGANDFRNIAEINSNNGDDGNPINDIDSDPDDDPTNDAVDEDDIDEVEVDVQENNAEIGDRVWNDVNGDGIQNGGEQGIPNVPVYLCSSDGTPLDTTTTSATGIYRFTMLPAGNYIVKFGVGPEYTATVPFATNPNQDSDVTGNNGPNSTNVFPLAAGQIREDIDGGFFNCVKICGMIWYDTNKNDINDSYENGINGLKVRLYRKVGNSWVLWDETLTGHKPNTPSDDGYFEFCTNPGTYYVKVIMPPLGLVQVRAGIGGPLNDSDLVNAFGPGTTAQFTLQGGGGKCDIKGGFYPMATVGNLVWHDDNNNGIQDHGETPASGVRVDLYDENANMVESYVTNIDGKYTFDYLEKKEYFLVFNPPAGYNFTIDHAGPDDMDSDVNHENGLNSTPKFMMDPGMHVINVDAGITQSVLPVEWLGVDVENRDEYHEVHWSVGLEINLDRYEITRSLDGGANFEVIGQTRPEGLKAYSFYDDDVNESGLYMYQIVQYDIDGKSTLSPIASIRRNSTGKLQVYPNPTTDFIHIDADNGSVYDVEIIASDGKVVITEQNITGHHSVDMSQLPNGKYLVKWMDVNGKTEVKQIIKIR